MNISILTVFPALYDSFLATSLLKRAQEKKIVAISLADFFSVVQPKERIDAPTFGPGAGLLLKPVVVERAIEANEKKYGIGYKIFFSPQGKKLDQRMLHRIAERSLAAGHLMLIPSRYEGMDARVEEFYADEVVSVGDFVLMGGDLPAMMLLEGLLRLVPGVVGKEESIVYESFTGPFVDYPEYTEPLVWKDKEVPEIVRSGNHAAIEQWRIRRAAKKTVLQHFQWIRSYKLNEQQKIVAREFLPSHYVALMHTQVVVGDGMRPGVTSVTSIDIHDIARSANTYGVKGYFVVTPLIDQQKIVSKFLDFWQAGFGTKYNVNRAQALARIKVFESLQKVIDQIESQEGKKPVIIATSARHYEHKKNITFYDQEIVWHEQRPVLFIFGTGKGLVDTLIEQCDYLLNPIHGFADYNHLSVRSAAAIVLDRWLGINEKIS